MINEHLFTSKSGEWETPQRFYDQLDDEFHFTLDPCATHNNAKCNRYFTIEDNGLIQSWYGEIVFMNPPYGREIKEWVAKAAEPDNNLVVCLLPARTDTAWFHNNIYCNPNAAIRFLQGRLKFSGHTNSAPFPSMIVIFDYIKRGGGVLTCPRT